MRVLIVDDDVAARARVRQLLAAHADVEVAGEAQNAIEAMEQASTADLQLMLLDIHMPGASGIDVAACLREPRPPIAFCTEFDEALVHAFDRHGVDYLLKPVNRAPLGRLLDTVRYLSGGSADRAREKRPTPAELRPRRFLVKNAQSYIALPESQVLCFESEGGTTSVLSEKGLYFAHPSLDEIEERFDPTHFSRISETAIVNLNAVADVDPQSRGSGEVVLNDGRRLEVSRSRFTDFLKALAAS